MTARIPTLALILLLLLGAATVSAQEQFTATWSGLPLFVPDKDADVTVAGLLFVPQAFEIQDVDIQVYIEHPKIKDLTVDLVSPEGSEIRLADRVCDTHGHFDDTIFDDESGAGIGSVCPPGPGRYRPNEDLDEVDGENTFGTWALRIRDREENDFVGFLVSWSVTFTAVRLVEPTITPEGVVNDASRLPGPIAPGEVISIHGAALGPNEPVIGEFDPNAGSFLTELGGVRVKIADQDAPLFLASLRKIQAQVPFEVPPGEFVEIQTFFGGQESNVIAVPVHNTSPGIFTMDNSGLGQAKVINPDGTLNDSSNPALRGDVVVVYATGLGTASPPTETGIPASLTEVSTVVFPVRASIGNAEADVLFAGPAPGLTGVYQLNLRVPTEIRPQNSASLLIEQDFKGSRLRVWMAVE